MNESDQMIRSETRTTLHLSFQLPGGAGGLNIRVDLGALEPEVREWTVELLNVFDEAGTKYLAEKYGLKSSIQQGKPVL